MEFMLGLMSGIILATVGMVVLAFSFKDKMQERKEWADSNKSELLSKSVKKLILSSWIGIVSTSNLKRAENGTYFINITLRSELIQIAGDHSRDD